MPISFKPRLAHPYYTGRHAAKFLALLYDCLKLTPGETLPVAARTLTFNSLRMKLSYGRKFIAESDEPAFSAYSDIASEIRILPADDRPGLLLLSPTPKFHALAAAFHPTQLFSFFRLVEDWLAAAKTSRTFTRHFDPPLAADLTITIETFAAARPGIKTSSVSPKAVFFCK